MTQTKQKHMNFPDEYIAIVEKYQDLWGINFTQAVLRIINNFENGLLPGFSDEQQVISNNGYEDRITRLEQNFSYFQSDETLSKISELERRLTILIKSSKSFKKHLEDREIHLMDK